MPLALRRRAISAAVKMSSRSCSFGVRCTRPPRSEQRQVVIDLPLGDRVVVADPFLPLDPQELGGQCRAEGAADHRIRSALGPALAAEFLRVKRQEWVRYHNTVSQWEIDHYLALF